MYNVDADALIEKLQNNVADYDASLVINETIALIKQIRIDAEWIPFNQYLMVCSACGKYWIPEGDEYEYNFCPHCGAKMF